jgi:membrane protein DedA with SNARE-associated domain
VQLIEAWLATLPPLAVASVVGVIIGLESMGLPLPGELTLVSAALLAAKGIVNPWVVATAAAVGAIIGDSIGYALGRRGGRAVLIRLGRRFPRHLGPAHLARAERTFARWGVWAVFFGRFVALLRILAGPLAGALRVPYHRFLIANAAGGVVWAYGTTLAVYYAGRVAENWLHDLSWAAFGIAVAAGLITTAYFKHRAAARARQSAAELAMDEPHTPAEAAVEAGTIAASIATAAAADLSHHLVEHDHGEDRGEDAAQTAHRAPR